MTQMPVFVESIPGGFRATTVGPADMTADGGTADAAVQALRAKVNAKLVAGAMVVDLRIDDDAFDTFLRRIASNPLLEQIHQDIHDARKESDEMTTELPS